MLTLIECLNKVKYFQILPPIVSTFALQVRDSQNLIVATQNSGMSVQASTNKILADVVTNLEQTHNILDRFRDGAPTSKMSSRLTELCDDLGKAVTGLLSAQDQLTNCGTNNMQQLEKLIKSASNIMREDTWNNKKRVSVMDVGPATKRRTGGGGIKMVWMQRGIGTVEQAQVRDHLDLHFTITESLYKVFVRGLIAIAKQMTRTLSCCHDISPCSTPVRTSPW